MRHYTTQFFVTETINKNTCIKVKPSIFDQYYKNEYNADFIKYHPNEWAEQQRIMRECCYDVKTSGIRITADNIEPYWHLHNLDIKKYPDWCNLDANYAHILDIDDSEYKFKPGIFEFDAPEIGEHFYLWENGHVYDVTVSHINIEIDPSFEHGYGWHFISIGFKDTEGKFHSLRAEGDEFCFEILNSITKYCRKNANEFTNEFWAERYEELRNQKDEEYKSLEKEFTNYKELY